MHMNTVEVQRSFDASIDAVWDRYTDHLSWNEWARIGKVRLDRQGTLTPNGVGCVRAISSAGITVFEEILSFDRPRRMTYRLIKGGMPIKDHLGEVIFEPQGRGTLVTWRCQFNSRIPGLGGLFRVIITKIFSDTLRRLSQTRFVQEHPEKRASDRV